MRSYLVSVLSFSVMLSGLVSVCHAETVEIATTDGSGGLSGQVEYAGTLTIGGTQWHVKNNNGLNAGTRKGYIRFDTSGINFVASHAELNLTVSLIDSAVADNDQTIFVYGITNQALDNVALTNGLPWASAPANNTGSASAADLSEAALLGTFVLDENGGKSTPVGTLIRFSNKAVTDFINADTNGLVTLILGRTGVNDEKNLLFSGDTHATYDPPTLVVDDASPCVVNSGSYIEQGGGGKAYTLSFNAGASANKLVVALVAESNAGSGDVTVTYNGTTMSPAYAFAASQVGIYYLDNPFSGGAANLTVDFTGVGTVNGMGFAAVSLSGAVPGTASVVATDSGDPAALDVDINVPGANSFILAGYNANGVVGTTEAVFPLASIFGETVGSAQGAVGYDNGVNSGISTYRFDTPSSTPRWVTVAAFEPIRVRSGTTFFFR